MLIKVGQSCLMVIDVQERLVPAMQAPARVIRNTRTLMTAAYRLGIPMLLTEQNPKGLGHIVPELQNLAKNGKVLEKIHFSCMNEPSFAAEFKALYRRQDALTPLALHGEMAGAIAGESLVVIENCGHLSPLERPRAVSAGMRYWLAR
jgi:pimeloyl-ACP methyl ester carboxylesterase